MHMEKSRYSIKKMITKGDVVLLIILIVAAFFSWFLFMPGRSTENAVVVISVDKEVYGEYPLNEDKGIQVRNGAETNYVEIKDGKVRVIQASCHNQDCVHQRAISKENESIICLPNKVIVTIRGGEESGIDSTSR